MPVSASEQRFLDAVSLDLPWSVVERFSTMPRWRPDDVNAAAEYIGNRLAEIGIPTEIEYPLLYLSIPLSASVTADGTTFRAKPPSSSLSVPEGCTAPLVMLRANPKGLRSYNRDVKTLFGDAFASIDDVRQRVGGKIVVMQGFGNPALTSLIEEWGGVGLIAVNPGVDIHWGTCTTIWGSPDLHDLPRKPKIPVVAVNDPDGRALMALAERGGSATIRTEMQEGWFRQGVPVAYIHGSEDPFDYVLLHGHYDSWDVGVGDNATGDATMLEIARVLVTHRARLRRSVKIAWWPGHSTGRYAGSTWFADAYALDLDRHCLAQINCDSPGCRWATSYHQTRAFPESAALAAGAIRDVVPAADIATQRPPQAGDYSFNNIGLPSCFMLSSTMPEALRHEKNYYDVSGCGGNTAWHTENDTLEIADRDILLTDIKIYLLTVLRVVNADVLPFDWDATCAEFLETIAAYQAAAGDAADLGLASEAVHRLRRALTELGGRDAATRNKVSKAIARILIPLNTTREPRFLHDPAYTVPKLPTLAVAVELGAMESEHFRNCALVELQRGQNRFIAAIDAACRLVKRGGAD